MDVAGPASRRPPVPPGSTNGRADDGLSVTVNGEERRLPRGATVADLVRRWCASPDGIAVARNREVVPRSQWATTTLSARDVVEVVSAAAGG